MFRAISQKAQKIERKRRIETWRLGQNQITAGNVCKCGGARGGARGRAVNASGRVWACKKYDCDGDDGEKKRLV